MMEADDCRKHAAECERLAKMADDPKLKNELLVLAQAWLQLEAPDSSEGILMEPNTKPTSPVETA